MSTCSSADFPFLFYDTNHDLVNGTLDGNSCIFPTANCHPDVRVQDCCTLKDEYADTGQLMHYTVIFVLFPFLYSMTNWRKSMTPEEKEAYDKRKKDRDPQFITQGTRIPKRLKNILLIVYNQSLWLSIVIEVLLSIVLAISIQGSMSAEDRTFLAASDAFMIPFYEIFDFVEHIVMIRIMYAISQNDRGLTDRLIHMGLAAVIASGILAGVVGTFLGVYNPALEGITNPGLSNDQALYPGCYFIESIDISTIFPYWMLKSWGCMGGQIAGVLSGFFLGSFELISGGWISIISNLLIVVIWYGNVETVVNPVTLKGIAEFVGVWILPVLFIGFMKSPLGAQVCERTGVELSAKKVLAYLLYPFKKETNTDSNENTEGRRKEFLLLIKQGLKVMFVDITIQFATTISVYLALNKDSAIAYQIMAMQSRLPSYGMSATRAMALLIVIMGPVFLKAGIFVDFVKMNVLSLVMLVLLIVAATTPFVDDLALKSGMNACEYASTSECVPYFNKVFGENGEAGTYTLFYSYHIFAAASCIEMILIIFRAVLLTLMDFDFMVYTAIAAGISYIPAIVIVEVAPVGFRQQAIAYFGTIYFPQLVMTLCFAYRLVVLLRKISNGEPGPWSLVTASTPPPAIKDKDMAAKAIAAASFEANAANYSGSGHEEIAM